MGGKDFASLDGVSLFVSGAIPEGAVLCTRDRGGVVVRFWIEMSDEEIADALINLLTIFSIEGALRRLGYYFRRYKNVKLGNMEGTILEILTQLSLENDLSELYEKILGIKEDKLDIHDEELDVLIRAVSPNVEWRKAMQGIAIRPVNQPALERIVKMPASVRDKVWDWLRNPRIVEDKNEREQLRMPIIAVLLEITKIIMEYNHPLHREILKRKLKEL